MTTEREYRFYSKLLLSLVIATIGLFLFISIYQAYHRKLRDAEEYTLKKLYSIANTLSIEIDGDAHWNLVCTFNKKDSIATNDDDEGYRKIYDLLNKTKKINELETPIYTMFYDEICGASESNNTLLFGVSSDVPIYRHTYKSPIKLHRENFEIGGMIGEYLDKHGHWLSAFAPIKNSKGETTAIVQVDESFNSFIKTAKQSALKDGLYALLILSLVGLGLLYLYRILLSEMSKINTRLDSTVKKKTTDLQSTNQALQTANEELADSNEKLQAFARIASHDLRAPLRRMSTFASLLDKKYGESLGEDGKEYINFITSNSSKLSDLISDILNTSLLQYQNSKAIEEINLNTVVNDVLSNLQDDIEAFNAIIEYVDLPTVKGYRSDFIQVFQNFISNSLKYRKPDTVPIVKIRSQQLNDSHKVMIEDNGLGISNEAVDSIFKEFDRGNAEDDKGYGIGLATCKRIIKDYQGTLRVESMPNVGSTFIFTVKNRILEC